MKNKLHDVDMDLRAVSPTDPSPVPHNKQRPTILVYATVSPETVVIPIVSCIFGFPLIALLVICCLRRRAQMARERERRRVGAFGSESAARSLVRLGPAHPLGVFLTGTHESRGRGRGEHALSRGFTSLDLDTVIEERSDPDLETTAVDISPPES